MSTQQNSILSIALNEYLDLYRRARAIWQRLVIVNLNQFTGDSVPFQMDELSSLLTNLITLRNHFTDNLTDGLVGDSPTDDVVEKRITFINMKMTEPSWGKLFIEYQSDEDGESIVNPEPLKKFYSSKEIETLQLYLNSIDSNIALINGMIAQAIQQVRVQYLQQIPENQSCDSNTSAIEPESNNEIGLKELEIFQREDVKRIFKWLIEDGIIPEDFHNWKNGKIKTKRKLSYLCYKFSETLDLGKSVRDGNKKDKCWQPFEILFQTKGLGNSFNQLQREYNYNLCNLYPDIDKYFD